MNTLSNAYMGYFLHFLLRSKTETHGVSVFDMGMLSRYTKLGSIPCLPDWDATILRPCITQLHHAVTQTQVKMRNAIDIPLLTCLWVMVPQSRNVAFSAFAIYVKGLCQHVDFSRYTHSNSSKSLLH